MKMDADSIVFFYFFLFFLNSHFPSTFFTWLRQCVAQPANQCSVQPHIGHRLVFI
jgi:hypothetical protein